LVVEPFDVDHDLRTAFLSCWLPKAGSFSSRRRACCGLDGTIAASGDGS
jgi:hypothetical protein